MVPKPLVNNRLGVDSSLPASRTRQALCNHQFDRQLCAQSLQWPAMWPTRASPTLIPVDRSSVFLGRRTWEIGRTQGVLDRIPYPALVTCWVRTVIDAPSGAAAGEEGGQRPFPRVISQTQWTNGPWINDGDTKPNRALSSVAHPTADRRCGNFRAQTANRGPAAAEDACPQPCLPIGITT